MTLRPLLVTLYSLLASATHMEWRDLLVHDCSGGLHVLPNTGFEGNANVATLHVLLDEVASIYYDRVKALCDADPTPAEFRRFFWPSVEMALGVATADASHAAATDRRAAAADSNM